VCLIYFRPKIGKVAITPNLSIMKNRYDMYMLISSKHVHILWSSVVKGQQTSCIHKLDYMWPLQRTTDKLYTQAWLHVTSTKDNRQVVYTSLYIYMWPLQRYRRVVDNRQVVYTSLVTCDLYKDTEGSWTTDKLYTQAWLHVTSTKMQKGRVLYMYLIDLLRKSLWYTHICITSRHHTKYETS
jgi:hypothetical protein